MRTRPTLSALTGLLLLLLGAGPGRAAAAECATPAPYPLAARDGWVALTASPTWLAQKALEPAAQAAPDFKASQPKPLEPSKAALLSLVVPGAAQIHDRRLKGYAMLGVEVGAWFAYQGLRSGGHDRENSA